jgi:pentatricopeptide repeat protein
MKALGIKPNRITYNSLIDTCVKSNKMNIAWKFYDEMIKADIVPDNFTYSILINGIKSNNTSKEELLKAINILEHIKDDSNFKPDEIFYNSLIDACVKFNEVNKGLSLFEEMKKVLRLCFYYKN